jgi:hypothetical protein
MYSPRVQNLSFIGMVTANEIKDALLTKLIKIAMNCLNNHRVDSIRGNRDVHYCIWFTSEDKVIEYIDTLTGLDLRIFSYTCIWIASNFYTCQTSSITQKLLIS